MSDQTPLTLRLWIAMRLTLAGVDKFRAGDGAAATFNSANYDNNTKLIGNLMKDNSFLPSILPPGLIDSYAHNIGYVLLAVGAWVVVGLFAEFSLLAAGLTFLSLGFGLGALPDDMELSANIGMGIALTALALITNKSGFISVDGLLRKRSKTAVFTTTEG